MKYLALTTRVGALLLALAALAGPASAQAPRRAETNSSPILRMGFTAFPWDFTAAAQAETYEWISQHADLITFHHDRGVPWPEALAGNRAYHPNLIAEIDAEVAAIRPGQTVYVSATSQDTNRGGGLAPYWAENSGTPLPPSWVGKTMDDPEVVLAYIDWCRYLIERFDPDYFAYGIECNGGFTGVADPALFQYATFAWQVYTVLKLENPDLPIFSTVLTGSTNSLRPEFLQLTSYLLTLSDLVGISSYPFMVLRYGGWDSHGDPGNLPDDLLTSITALAPGKPIAITETGYIAEDLMIPEYGLFIEGRPEWQEKYVRRLLREATQLDAEFVVWFVSRDYDMGLQTMRNFNLPIDPSFYIWRDNGLRDGAGNARPALAAWDRWLTSKRAHRRRALLVR